MYVTFDEDFDELITAIRTNPIMDDEYWMILLADKHLPKLESIVEQLQQNDIPFFGAVFPGLIVGKRMYYQGAILQKVRCLIPPTCIPLPLDKAQANSLLPTCQELPNHGATCISLIDCLSPDIDELLNFLYNRYDNRCSYFGAGAGNGQLNHHAVVFSPSGIQHHAAIIAIVPQSSNSVAKHGWKRHSGPAVASRTTGNILHEIDWEDAEDAYRAALPVNLQNTPPERFYQDVTPRYPFAVESPGTEDVVRDPIALFNNGDVQFLSDIPQGALMYLMEGTPEQLIEAAKEAVNEALQGKKTQTVLVCDCLSRTVALDNQFPAELRTVYEAIHAQQPELDVEGVLALGEIASNGARPVNFYNKTFGICCIHE